MGTIREYVMMRGEIPHEKGDFLQAQAILGNVDTFAEAKDMFEKMKLYGGIIGIWIQAGKLYMVGSAGFVGCCDANLQG